MQKFWAVVRVWFFVKILIGLSLCFFLIEAGLMVRYSRTRSVYTFDALNKVLRETTQTLDEVRKAATKANEASQNQINNLDNTQKSLNQLVADTNTNLNKQGSGILPRLSFTVDRVNNEVLPQVTQNLKDLDASQVKIANEFIQTIDDLKPTLNNLAKSSQSAADILADPNLKDMLVKAALASDDAERAANHIADIAANGDEASKLLLAKLKDALKPVPFIRTLLLNALGWTSQGVQIYYGTHK